MGRTGEHLDVPFLPGIGSVSHELRSCGLGTSVAVFTRHVSAARTSFLRNFDHPPSSEGKALSTCSTARQFVRHFGFLVR